MELELLKLKEKNVPTVTTLDIIPVDNLNGLISFSLSI